MRLLLQRVASASVAVDGAIIGSIGQGYLLFLGVLQGDGHREADWLAAKVTKLRLFDGADGNINDRSIIDIGGDILVISQFTLAGAVERGNRPDYTAAEQPKQAEDLYNYFVHTLRALGVPRVETGSFGAHMQVTLVNNGPVTLLLERPPLLASSSVSSHDR